MGREGGAGGKMSGPSTSSLSVITVTTFFFSNYKAGAVWLSLLGMLGRERGTREGERRTPLLFSHRTSWTFLLLSPPPQKKKNKTKQKKMASATQSMIGYGEGTYSLEFMRVSNQGMNLPETDQGLGFVRVTLVLL